jgi:putative addiction module component (TIGR02574 family)
MVEDRLAKLLGVPPGERIDLARGWWDRMRPEDLPPLSAEQQAVIERRLDAHARNPSRAAPWREVRIRLGSRRK